MPYFVLTFLWIGILRVLPRWNARKQFMKQPGAQGPHTVLMDTTGVHWHNDESCSASSEPRCTAGQLCGAA